MMMIPGAPKYDIELCDVGNNVVCYLFESRVSVVSCKHAGIFWSRNDLQSVKCCQTLVGSAKMRTCIAIIYIW